MSVESGFKTFRGNDGLWENYPVEKVATHEGWEADPTLVTNFYNSLRRKLFDAQPNEGHRLIAQLEEKHDVVVVTQNVDNLHEKAGSTNVIHLHGELTKVCSSRDAYDSRYIRELTADNPEVEPGTLAGDGSLLAGGRALPHRPRRGCWQHLSPRHPPADGSQRGHEAHRGDAVRMLNQCFLFLAMSRKRACSRSSAVSSGWKATAIWLCWRTPTMRPSTLDSTSTLGERSLRT